MRLLIVLLLLTGCGPSAYMQQQLTAYNSSMAVYQQATAAKASQPPMVSVSFHSDGRLASLAVAQPIEYPNIPAFRPVSHPGWALGSAGIRAAGVVGGIFAGGWAISELAATMTEAAGTHYNGTFTDSPINSTGNFAPNGQFAGGDGIFNPVSSDRGGTSIFVPVQPNSPIDTEINFPPPEPPVVEPPIMPPIELLSDHNSLAPATVIPSGWYPTYN